MTRAEWHGKKRRSVLYLFLLCFGGSILFDAETAANAVHTGLRLCATSAIPALFPFMVLSELVVKSGLGALLGKPFGKAFEKIFALPREALAPLFLGLICGFPIGARSALTLLDEGLLDTKETECLLSFCNIQSSAFLISAVGGSLYGNPDFGIFLYLSSVASSILIGLLRGRGKKVCKTSAYTHKPSAPLDISTFTDAVSSSASGMLSICAYILFFSAVIGSSSRILIRLRIPTEIQTLLCGILELTTGTSMASSIENPWTSAVICSFLVGFGGLSVGCQLLSFCRGRGLSLSHYFVAKALQGLMMTLFCIAYLALASDFIKKGESVSAFSPMVYSPKYIHITLIFFFISLIFLAFKTKKAPA